jgi:fused signal recognition particle receptor
MGLFSFFTKEKKEDLDKGLEKTKDGFLSKITRAIAGKSKIDDEVLDNLEEALVSSDVGLHTTVKIIKRIEERAAKDKFVSEDEMNRLIRSEIENILAENKNTDLDNFDTPADKKPFVLMVVGVNGAGKTTTIGKLAYQFKKNGKRVLLGAADTFRAAAVDQLESMGQAKRCGNGAWTAKCRPRLSRISGSGKGTGH